MRNALDSGRAQALRRRGIPGWGVFGEKDKQGGGPLIGIHILDAICKSEEVNAEVKIH